MAKKITAANIVLTLIIVIFLVIVIGIISIDGILRSGIKAAIKKQLNLDSSVSKVSLNILSGTLEITNLQIKNPPGYQFPNALDVQSIFVKTSIGGLLGNPVEIEEIRIDGAVMSIEQKGFANNIGDILKGMPEKQKTGQSPADANQNPKKVHIALLDINDTTVNAKLLPIGDNATATTLTLAPMHFTNLGGDKSLSQVVGKIFTEITNAVVKSGGGILPTDITSSLQKGIEQHLGGISEEGKQLLEKSGQELEKKANETLKGLFQKK